MNANIIAVAKKVAKKEIQASDALGMLTESRSFDFKKGEKVYVAHGIHAGSYGTIISECNGAYFKVDMKAGGKSPFVPAIFLQRSKNR